MTAPVVFVLGVMVGVAVIVAIVVLAPNDRCKSGEHLTATHCSKGCMHECRPALQPTPSAP